MFETNPRCLPVSTTGVKYLVARLSYPDMYAAAGVYFAARQEGQKDEGQAFGQERFYQVGLWIFVIGFVLFA